MSAPSTTSSTSRPTSGTSPSRCKSINIYNAAYFPSPFTSVPVPGWTGRYYTPDNGDSGEVAHDRRRRCSTSTTGSSPTSSPRCSAAVATLLSLNLRIPPGSCPGDSTTVVLPERQLQPGLQVAARPLQPTSPTTGLRTPSGSVGNGGGYTTAGNNNFSNANLRNEATLYEVGTKWSLIGNQLFLNTALFKQIPR
jgi:hypothetical protein